MSAAIAAISPGAQARFRVFDSRRLRRLDFWVLAAALVCYFVLAIALARTKAPWVDEGWIASAPANWAQTGSFGTPSLEPAGSWLNAELTGIKQYTYWNFPVAVALQAVWFKIFGFSVFTMRLLSILFGALALISWSAIVTDLSGIRFAGPLTAMILATDYTFVWGAADGRMDMICLAFGAGGLAAYLLLREAKWRLSLWLANICIALAVFTHPNGLMCLVSFLFLLVYYDRSRLSWRDLATLNPYFLGGALWAIYILQRPDYFIAQFAANAGAHGGSRWAGFTHPVGAVLAEIACYLRHYGIDPIPTDPVPTYAMVIPFIDVSAIAAGWLSASMRRHRGLFGLLCLVSIHLVFMTFFMGLKLPMYLVFILPLYAALVVVGTYIAFREHSCLSWPCVIVVGALMACQVGTLLFMVHGDSYHREYLPTAQFVRERSQDNAICANSYFGFELGFTRVKDDARLGFYSGLRPDLIIVDTFYKEFWEHDFGITEPEVALYVENLLNTEYRAVFERGRFCVYERRRFRTSESIDGR